MTERDKLNVRNKVNKEFRDYQNECLAKGALYTFNNGLKIAFYKEMRIFVLNGVVTDSMYGEMLNMDDILTTLWNRYKSKVVDNCGDHFLAQLIDFHDKNLIRVKERLGDTYGKASN